MHIRLNNKTIELPEEVTSLSDLLKWKDINENGLAIALNGRLSKRPSWDKTKLKENDDIVMIEAAFGG